MKSKCKLLIPILVMSSFTLKAADWNSTGSANGGQAIVCRDSGQKIQSAHLVDFHEAINLRQLYPLTSESEWPAIAREWVQRLHKASPFRMARMKEVLEDFVASLNQKDYLLQSRLVLAPDDFGSVHNDCKVEQIVRVQTPRFAEDKRFLINSEIWQALSETDKAGVVVHSALILDNPTADQSLYIRYFVSILAADRVPELKSDQDRLEFFRDRLRFNYGEAQGLEILLIDPATRKNAEVSFHPNRKLESGILARIEMQDRGPEKNLRLLKVGTNQFRISNPEKDSTFDRGPQFTFYSNGRLRSVAMNIRGLILSSVFKGGEAKIANAVFADQPENPLICAGLESGFEYRTTRNTWKKYDLLAALSPVYFKNGQGWESAYIVGNRNGATVTCLTQLEKGDFR